ncbi:MAG: ABC transporter permease [Chitinophagaceae bacterium]|nr:ABC transporter permease [Chitinophagaceae bacterium]
MLKNYLRVILKIASKNKVISVFNILGLSTGIASFIAIIMYVNYQLSFDRSNEDSNNLYRIVGKFSSSTEVYDNAQTTPALIPSMINISSQIKAATRLFRYRSDAVIVNESTHTNYVEPNFLWADADVFKVFTIPMIKGNSVTALNEPSSVVISESTARKYFGDKDPVGRLLNNVTFNSVFKITGVFKNLPGNMHFKADFICSLSALKNNWGEPIMHDWNNSFLYSYVRLASLKDVSATENFINKQFHEHISLPQGNSFRASLQRVTDIHLHSHLMNELGENANIMYIYILSCIGILILIVSCINFVNLGIARAEHRSKEIGIRKVLGSSKKSIFSLVVAENILYGLIAFIISLVMVFFMLAVFKPLNFQADDNIILLPVCVGFIYVIFIVCLSSVYPSVFMASLKVVEVFKGKTVKIKSGMSLWKMLIVFQVAVSAFLIIATLILNKQLAFLQSASLGYEREHIINIPLLSDNAQHNAEQFKARLLQNSSLQSVCATSHLIGAPLYQSGFEIIKSKEAPSNYTWQRINADEDYANTNELKIVAGRNFLKSFGTDSSNFIINEAACKALGLQSPQQAIGLDMQGGEGNKHGKIVGVLQDFHFKSLHYVIEPLVVFSAPDRYRFLTINFKSNANLQSVLNAVKNEWNQFDAASPFVYSFPDQFTTNLYSFETNLQWIISLFTVIAIVLSIGGVIGLNYYITQLKAKEIGIRKVLGANVSSILKLLSIDFIKLSIIAMLISFPLAWIAAHAWLQDFAYRINVNARIFFVTGIIVTLLVLATISFQSIKTAIANPVKSLRTE